MRKLSLVILVIFLISVGLNAQPASTSSEGEPEFDLTFAEKVTLLLQDEERLFRSRSRLNLEASVSKINLESVTAFDDEKRSSPFFRQELKLDYNIRRFSTQFHAVLDSSINGLDYWLQKGNLDEKNLDTTALLLLEYIEEDKVYGSGFGLKMEGTTEKDIRLSGSIYFGMDRYLREVHDPTVKGSGYYIINEEGVGPSEFPFGSALIEISDIGLGHCIVANRTKFMRGEGFLFSGFSFDLIKDKEPWKTRSYVYFTDENETVTLVPTFQFGEDNWTVVADFGGKFEKNDTTLGKIEIRGLKFNKIFAEKWKISGTLSLAGKMKKKKGANQLELRAEDYSLTRSFDEIAENYLFEQVNYSDVITLEYDRTNKEDLRRYMAFDLYFESCSGGGLFDLMTFNGVTRWGINPGLTIESGISIHNQKGPAKIFLNLLHDF
ncbi:hypothetical protein K9M06_04200 [Candidatus Bipolaricaulota bacterium]|nr:hypothetical protein [Candidatus Bipolaricaulota bacterium]